MMGFRRQTGYRLVALLAAGGAISHAQSFLEGSYVVVRERSSRSKEKCTIAGKLRVGEATQIPAGTMLLVVRALVAADGKVVVSDVDDSERIIDRLPVLVTAISPGHDSAQVILSTCRVNLDFFLAKSRRLDQ
jgi:SOS-response transcriptional repressor LexA